MNFAKAMTAVEASNLTQDNVKKMNLIEDLMNDAFQAIKNACEKGDTFCVYMFNSEQDDQPIINFCSQELNDLGFMVEHDVEGSELKIMWGNS